MIFDASTLPLPGELKADLCVIGSGPGGATAAMIAAEAGLNVVLLEAGPLVLPSGMTQREADMIPRLYWEAGARMNRDRSVRIHQGRGVGGSSLHNINLCKRIPATIRERWARERGLSHLPPAAWDALYAEIEALLTVSVVPEAMRNEHNRLLARGCESLGWAGGPLSHNRSGCAGSGFCEVGCPFDAKNNAFKIMIPRAVKAGCRILSRCQAIRVLHHAGAVIGVEAVAIDEATRRPLGSIVVRCGRVCLASSATGSAALLLRSDVPGEVNHVGRTLHIHPGVAAAGEFEEPVRAFSGVPQSYECTEWLGFEEGAPHRVWITPAFAHPMGFATMMPGHGEAHYAMMSRYSHMAVFSAMLHDRNRGSVKPDGDLGLRIDYRVEGDDERELLFGLASCARLLRAAGAKRIILPTAPAIVVEPGDDLDRIEKLDTRKTKMDVIAVHPMGTIPMGDDPAQAAVDSAGAHHKLKGLWVSDGSLFPSSIGVPPQLSIYAMGLHVGRAIASAR